MLADWMFEPMFGTGFVVSGEVVMAGQSEPVQIVITERNDLRFEVWISRSGERDTAVTAERGRTNTWTWFGKRFTELPD